MIVDGANRIVKPKIFARPVKAHNIENNSYHHYEQLMASISEREHEHQY